ncbi:MAG: GTP-binding protein, partial [Planctomycetales bacterium]|nr:GTP-binding protein [Planctomycetales bacterium]
RAAAVLLDQLNGSLSVALDRLVAALRSNLLPQADSMLTELLKWADFGLHLSRPWRIVLAGPPNVGKSSLTNAILGSQRAIVHEQPGTTRDWTETLTAIDGWPVSITDTAGIRLAKDEIERQGIELATAQLQRADLVVIMVDAQVGWTEVHARLLQQAPRRRIIAWNKCDLMEANYDSLPSDLKLVPSVRLSCVNGIGIESLIRLIAEGLVPEIPQPGVAIAFRESQVRQLRLALRAVHDQSPEVALSGIQSLRCGPTQYGDDQH